MIFGFNTDIKHEDTVYHVQSEARESELILQTQVFVRGRCIGKRATPYNDYASEGAFTDQQKEHHLRDLHRQMLDAIREGRLNEVIDRRDSPETLALIKELDVVWTDGESVHSDDHLNMRLKVIEDGNGVEGARLTVRFARADAAPFYAQLLTDAGGNAELTIDVNEEALPEASILVQANHSGRTATRKFELRKNA